MSTSIPQLVAYLTRPLIAAGIPAVQITTAQIILHTSLASQAPPAGTLTLSADAKPVPPLVAASLGAGIDWKTWYTALAGKAERLAVVYGPGYLKIRTITNAWTENKSSSIQIRPRRTHLPTLAPIEEDSSSSSSDDCDSDTESDVSSATDYSSSSSAPLSPNATPFVPARLRSAQPALADKSMAPVSMRPPLRGPRLFTLGLKSLSLPTSLTTPTPSESASANFPKHRTPLSLPTPTQPSLTHTRTSLPPRFYLLRNTTPEYMYLDGVTRVMTGRVPGSRGGWMAW
ncbi:hypothetical protein C8F01DRAFT_34223 [Mycena amicta]|nr:hypothetical protein C8F01DRAFT_34223 [Mycena amicta]